MKKLTRFSLLLAILSLAVLINPLKAQDVKKEVAAFTKKFEEAFNKRDTRALKDMFTKDAVRVGTDGATQTGIESIGAVLDETLKNKITLTTKPGEIVKKDGNTESTGTYQVIGTTESGETIDSKGSYVNTLVKVNGQWKIAKQVLTEL